jgi:hypothetical protein
MGASEGIRLSAIIREKLGELDKLCAGLDETTASRAPSGRWSPKEILSHLSGAEGKGLVPLVRMVLEQETPNLDFEPANPFYTGKRQEMTFAELLAGLKSEYEGLADMVAGLTDEDLARRAHVPLFKETPLGEYPALGAFVRALAEQHFDFHIAHMKEILEALKAGQGIEAA